MEEKSSLLLYDAGAHRNGCVDCALTQSVTRQNISERIIYQFLNFRFTGNEKEHPLRRLELSVYESPVTIIGSDGSEIANSLDKAFGSLLDVGTVYHTDDVDGKIIEMATGKMSK